MTDQGFQEASRTVLDEITRTLAQVDPDEVAALEQAILSAQAVFVVAMRLSHLGLHAHVVGETVTPPVGPGDLVIAISGSGETPTTLAAAQAAGSAGVKMMVVTAVADSPLARAADGKVVIPTGSGASGDSRQYGGSRFEQALMLMFDTIALRLQRRLAETPERMDQRHANLE
jgi:6-phospho-3-hexuloisomerase